MTSGRNKKFFLTVVLIFFFFFILSSGSANSASGLVFLDKPVVDIIKDLTNFILSIAGDIALFVLIISGICYAASGSNSNMQNTAKRILYYDIIGLVIILVSYALITVMSNITTGETISITNANINPRSGAIGTTFTISANIKAPASVDSATTFAYIQKPDEANIATILLVDDGTNGDVTSGDGIYTGQWISTANGPYFVDISACDIEGNCKEVENI